MPIVKLLHIYLENFMDMIPSNQNHRQIESQETIEEAFLTSAKSLLVLVMGAR